MAANAELVQAVDYILNRCNERDIEAVAQAVVRRRKDLQMFGGVSQVPDSQRLAEQITAQFNVEGSMEVVRSMIQDAVVNIIRQEAPGLSDAQVQMITNTMISGATESAAGKAVPRDMLEEMVNQFAAYSVGAMPPEDDARLRAGIANWPERYWEAFPASIKSLIKDLINGTVEPDEFQRKLRMLIAAR
jgi:hypothetical protein